MPAYNVIAPALLSHRLEDQVALLPAARYTASVFSHARSSICDKVGHMPLREDTARFNRELAEFVTQSNHR